ncbi:RCC1 domain-containing protein [Shewanella sedimentimangrovi]|uniref:CARDB domain-containing protein n=1 Tax=Shewanella sedimentimangrovi TaxID=2814293 RepID=A0ABX7R4G0_9GAMM|nr:CARDB domain-containing protein [Shewanella sedimentimangrovi]QSX37718.1 hypothetical protein JYB85_02425 [Shewanella sedimentimangrovi]
MPKKTHFRRTQIQCGLALLGLALPWLHAQAAPQIEIGNNSIHIIKEDGSLWSWGENSNGQIGLGSFSDVIQSPQAISGNWFQVSASRYLVLSIKSDGSLWMNDWDSSNGLQQLGTDNDWVEVSVGGSDGNAILRKTDGSIWLGSWQYREPEADRATFVIESLDSGTDVWLSVALDAAYFERFWAIRADHSLWYFKRTSSYDYQTNRMVYRIDKNRAGVDTDWQSFSQSTDTVLVVKKDKSLWQAAPEPVQKYDSTWLEVDSLLGFYAAIKEDGTLWQWGNFIESDEQSVDGYKSRVIEQPEQVGTSSDWTHVNVGNNFAIAQKADGSYWGWGVDDYKYGFRGIDYRLPGQIGAESDWQVTRTGGRSSFAIKSDGTLWSWGYGAELGLNNGWLDEWGYLQTPAILQPQQVNTDTDWADIRVGWTQVVALKKDGSIWSWGSNYSGALGLGLENDPDVYWLQVDTPTRIGNRTDWVKIAAAEDTSYAIDSSGRLWGWGQNDYGQIGDGTDVDRNVPTQVGSDTDWRDVAGGWGHTLAIKSDGSLWAWGDNSHGLLGDGTTETRLSPVRIGTDNDWQAVAAGDSHSIALKKDGSIWGWGNGGSGPTGLGNFEDVYQPTRIGVDNDWVEIGAGDSHSVAVKADNSHWSWGHKGQTGLGSLAGNQNLPARMPSSSGWLDLGFGADSFHATGVSCDGGLWSWGWNNGPELGQGITPVVEEPVQILLPPPAGSLPLDDSRSCQIANLQNIDLQIVSASVTTTGSINAGSNLDAEFSISNLGSIGTSSEPFVAQWYLSTDNQIDANDIALNSVLLTGMNSGETLAYSNQVNIPITTQATSYFLMLLIDATNTQTESDENNNSFNLGQITVARPNGRPDQPPGKIRRKQ